MFQISNTEQPILKNLHASNRTVELIFLCLFWFSNRNLFSAEQNKVNFKENIEFMGVWSDEQAIK